MSNYIKLVATIQQNLKTAINQAHQNGWSDLAILLGVCYNKLNEDGDKTLVKQAMKDIHLEAYNRFFIKMIGFDAKEDKKFKIFVAIDEKPYEFVGIKPVSETALKMFEPVDDGFHLVKPYPADIEHSISFFLLPEFSEGRGAPKALAQKIRMDTCPKCKRVKKESEKCPFCPPEVVDEQK